MNQSVGQNIAVLLGVTVALALAALVLVLAQRATVSSVRRRFAWISGESAGDADTLQTLLATIQRNSHEITELQNGLQQLELDARTHFQYMGLVRYDAFDGVAGQQSYSLCLLNREGNGVLITSLVGTNFSRGYAVQVKAGEAQRKLGDEEAEALKNALAGTRAA